jgi:hypothetical protein
LKDVVSGVREWKPEARGQKNYHGKTRSNTENIIPKVASRKILISVLFRENPW